MRKSIKYSLLLALTAMIWGAAFVAQSAGMDYMGPYTFNCLRFFLGIIVLLPFIFIKDRKASEKTLWNDKALWKGGIICGVFLFLASTTQQLGIVSTTAGKSGFITAFYIVLVPIFSLFLKKKPGKLIWISVALAIVGLYFLCMTGESLHLVKGDIFLFACAVLFSLQILAIDVYAPTVDCLKLTVVEFLVSGVCGIPCMIFEAPTLSGILAGYIALGYAGFFSCGVAYTLQVVAQKEVKPSVASLIMSLEAVFSVIFGFLILKEHLSFRECMGCFIMFAAVILAQVTPSHKEKGIAMGERVYLREMTKEDTEDIVRWRNAPFVVKNFIYRIPLTIQDHENWIESKVKTGLVKQFVICDAQTGQGFGSIYFRDINEELHTCEFGIFIGEEDRLGKGLGYEAQKLSMDYVFEKMNMNEVSLRVLATNKAAIHNYEKCGFRLIDDKQETTADGEIVLFMKAMKP